MRIRSGVTAALAGLVPISAFADPSEGHFGPHMWDGGWGWSIMGHGLMTVFWIVLIVLIVVAVRAVLDRPKAAGKGGSDAFTILRERFARGEIDQAEFDERRKTLES